jgi:hypothetical protein
VTTVYFAGGEDSEFIQSGGGSVDTTSGHWRSSWARCALATNNNPSTWQNLAPFSASTFWATARLFVNVATNGNTINTDLIAFLDSGGVKRLAIRGTGTAGQLKAVKINAVGTVTQIGSNFTWPGASALSGAPDKLDLNVTYAVAGALTFYLNGVQLFTFSGDVTTDSVTSLATIQFSGLTSNGHDWSEVIVTDADTRSLGLLSLPPVANGNTHNFDTGTPAAANVNEITLSDATLDGSSTAGQIDEYTIGSLPAGSFTILAVGVSARMQKSATGPSKMDLLLRSGTTDYASADQVLTTSWANYQNWWATDPNTSASWAALPANIGLKSVT